MTKGGSLTGGRRLLCVIAAAVALTAATKPPAEPASFARPLARVRAMPAVDPGRPVPPLAGRTRCIGVEHVAGAVVFGDRAVELTMADGKHWRMIFEQQCPALSFYQGFYYRRAVAGKLCAGKDAVIARSGGECAIASIIPVAQAAKPVTHRRVKRHR